MNADEIHLKAGELITKNKDFYLRMPGIKAVSLGKKTTGGKETGELAIKFHVEKKLAPGDLSPNELIPAMIEKIKTDVVLYSGEPEEEINPQASYRPMVPGLGIGCAADPRYSGTLGCFIKIDTPRTTSIPDPTGEGYYRLYEPLTAGIYLLTNAHVTEHCTPADTVIRQPAAGGPTRNCSRVVATMKDFKHDCSVAKLIFPTPDNAYINEVIVTPLAIRTFDRIDTPAVDDEVYKIGARTGYTEGIVTDINFHSATSADVVRIKGWSDCGDSGSVWIKKDNNRAVSLHYAGVIDATTGVKYCYSYDIKTQIETFAETGGWSIA